MSNDLFIAIKASLAVGAGGFFGAMARYGVAQAVSSDRFPWGTLIANLVGCLLIGVLKTTFDRSEAVSPALSLAILTGFLGAFTTFSTFSFETVSWWREDWRVGAGYLAFSVVAGLALIIAGIRISERWIGS